MLDQTHIDEINHKIVLLDDKIAQQDKNSVKYNQLVEIKRELQKMIPVKVHKDPNDNLCDGCQ